MENRVRDSGPAGCSGGLGEGLRGGHIRVLADERTNRRDPAGERCARGRLEIVGARPDVRGSHRVQVHVGIYPSG
jgi:hypothetical protein